jgi:tetratricopeptide (TPR) repeat protein
MLVNDGTNSTGLELNDSGNSLVSANPNDGQQQQSIVQNNIIEKKDLPFPKDGLTLQEMRAFMDQFNLRDCTMTTTEVCQQCLLAATASELCSYCDMLKQRGSDGVGIATVFISHAWKYRFADVVNALEYHFRDSPDIFIWFDLFSNNQHAAGNLPFDWWATTFKSAIAQFGRVVMVLSPWNDPIPFTRAWCLFEIYSAVSTNSQFEVAMSKSDFKLFLQSIKYDQMSFLAMLGTIDLLKCEAFNPDDRDRIFEVVKSEVGFSTLNGMVKGKMREWVDATLSSRVKSTTDMSVEAIHEKQAYANTIFRLGQYEKSLELQRQCLDMKIQLFGERHIEVTASYNNIGCICDFLGRSEEALEIHKKSLEIEIESLGERDVNVATSYGNIGNTYYYLGRFDEALEYHKKSLDIRIEAFGDRHPNVAPSYSNIANICDSLGRYEEALQYHKKSIEIEIDSFGERHFHVATSYSNIGNTYYSLGRYDEALEYHKKCLDIKIESFGDRHPDVANSYTNIGRVLTQMSNYIECEGALKQALNIMSSDSVMLSSVYFAYGEMYMYQGNNPSEATRYYQLCLDGRGYLHGSDTEHVEIADCLYGLGMVCVSVGSYDEALLYLSKCLAMRLSKLPARHRDVAKSYYGLGVIYYRQGLMDEARDYLSKALEIQLDVLGDQHKHTRETKELFILL